MSFLKKISNLLSKMTSSRKNEKIVEALNQKAKPKEDPVQDIEDLIKTQYASPLQTRSQRLKRTQAKAISSIAPEGTAANLKVKPIQLLKSENLINTSRAVKAEVKQLDLGIVPDVHLASATDPGQALSLGVETRPGSVLAAAFSHPGIEANKSQQLFDSEHGKCDQITSTNVESVNKKIDAKAARKAGKVKRTVKTEPVENTSLADDSVKDGKSSKAKSPRKTKALVAPKTGELEEKPLAKKKSPKKETMKKRITSSVEHELMPIPSTLVKPSKESLKLASLQFSPNKIKTNSTAIKVEVADDADEIKAESKRKRASPLKPKEVSDSEPEIKLEKWQPEMWPVALENIKLMRTFQEAPVDQMGCHKCCDENADEKTKRFQHLVALMLSSQTRDQITYEVMQRLRENTCTPASIVQMSPEELMQILHPVSFYKSKTKYLQNTAKILIDKYDSDIPNNVNELIKLPGVGPKMAHICMSVAWDMITGIGVDTHVHRISNRLGWVKNTTKEPEQTRKQLEQWLPSEHWREVNYLLVGFGQTLCTPVRPKCDQCLNSAFCPSANVTQTTPKKEIKIEKQEEA